MQKSLLLLVSILLAFSVLMAQQMDDTPTHSKNIQAVDEYLPAPGQFVNTIPECAADDTPKTVAEKCTERIAGDKGDIITLGAYGGYITFHFDHSIANVPGQRDIYIKGNAYAGNSEPGIVMVAKDINHNGLPDDPWYEIAGSADVDNSDQTIHNYEITYSPNPLGNITWTDNQGQQGEIDRNAYHDQEYFPLWHQGPLTYHGTLLPKNAVNNGTGNTEYWVMSAFRYGYADNAPNGDIEACSIDISWAVDADRQPVELDFVDFVRVYNGENQKCGWIGETSTEISGAEDLHLEESIQAITNHINSMAAATTRTIVSRYSLEGHILDPHALPHSPRGLQIIRYSDGTVRKEMLKK